MQHQRSEPRRPQTILATSHGPFRVEVQFSVPILDFHLPDVALSLKRTELRATRPSPRSDLNDIVSVVEFHSPALLVVRPSKLNHQVRYMIRQGDISIGSFYGDPPVEV